LTIGEDDCVVVVVVGLLLVVVVVGLLVVVVGESFPVGLTFLVTVTVLQTF
jgi:hypothetical protein